MSQKTFETVTKILSEALGIEQDDIRPESVLRNDLGAESIDMLDITFRVERTFGIKVPRNELFPDHVFDARECVVDGSITPEGVARLRAALPHSDFSAFEKAPTPDNIPLLFTVDTIVRYVDSRTRDAAPADHVIMHGDGI
jgi:acyl carrier protein